MRRPLDGHMSLQRYMALLLPAPWDVRRSVEAGSPPERPFAVVSRNGPVLSSGGREVFTVTMPFTVSCYPPSLELRQESDDQALELAEALMASVEVGVAPARHRRLPLWDFDAATVPAGEAVPFRSGRDFMRVDADPQVNLIRDPDDPRLVTVALDVRCTFARSQPVPSGQTTLQSVRLRGAMD